MSDWAKSNATRLMALETQRQETDARSQQEISILKLRRFRLFSGGASDYLVGEGAKSRLPQWK